MNSLPVGKAIRFPLLDNFLTQTAEVSIIFGLATIGIVLLTRYLTKRSDGWSFDEEKINIIQWIGIGSTALSICLFIFLKFA